MRTIDSPFHNSQTSCDVEDISSTSALARFSRAPDDSADPRRPANADGAHDRRDDAQLRHRKGDVVEPAEGLAHELLGELFAEEREEPRVRLAKLMLRALACCTKGREPPMLVK